MPNNIDEFIRQGLEAGLTDEEIKTEVSRMSQSSTPEKDDSVGKIKTNGFFQKPVVKSTLNMLTGQGGNILDAFGKAEDAGFGRTVRRTIIPQNQKLLEKAQTGEEIRGRDIAAGGLEAGSFFVPGGKAAATAKGRIAQQTAKSAASGFLSSSAGAASEAESVEEAAGDIAKGTFWSGLFGLALSSAGELRNIGRKGSDAKKALEAKEKALNKYKDQIKDNKSAQAAIQQHGGIDEMRKTALKEGIDISSTSKLEKQLKDYGPKFESEVNEILSKNKNVGLDFNKTLQKSLKDIDKAYSGVDPQRAESMKKFLIDSYSKTQPIQTPDSFNRLRKGLDTATKGKPLDSIGSIKKEAQKFLVTNMRGEMGSKVKALQKPMSKYATMATMLDVMKPDKDVSFLKNIFFYGATPGAIAGVGAGPVAGATTAGAIGGAKTLTDYVTSPQLSRKLQSTMASRATQKATQTNIPNVLNSLVGSLGRRE